MIVIFLTGALIVVVGMALALVGVVFGRRNTGFNARAIETQAKVVRHREHYSTSGASGRRIYFPEVRYTTEVGQTLEATAPGEREPLAEGTMIPLLYDPIEPSQVSFTGRRGGGGIAKVVGAMGCLIALTGLALIVGMVVLMAL
jgi:Protein of unknown function (DUF3592)